MQGAVGNCHFACGWAVALVYYHSVSKATGVSNSAAISCQPCPGPQNTGSSLQSSGHMASCRMPLATDELVGEPTHTSRFGIRKPQSRRAASSRRAKQAEGQQNTIAQCLCFQQCWRGVRLESLRQLLVLWEHGRCF